MKKIIQCSTLVLVLAMLVSLCAGCSGTVTTASTTAAQTNQSVTQSSSGTAATTAKFATTQKIVFIHPELNEDQPDFDKVVSALNTLTKSKINVEAKILNFPISTLMTQINLMLSGNEQLDLMWVGGDVSNMISKNQLAPLDELLTKYGQGISDAMGNLVNSTILNGKKYGLSHNNCKIYDEVIVCNNAILKELNLNLDNVKSIFDMAPILEKVKAAHPELLPFAVNTDAMSSLNSYMLGFGIDEFDNFQRGSVAAWMGDPNYKIENLITTEVYKKLLTNMREWYLKGYVAKDGATASESANSLFKSGKAFSMSHHNYFSPEQNKAGTFVTLAQAYGQEALVKVLSKPSITNGGIYNVSIAQQSKVKEATMAWLNLFYSDAECYNLLCRGIKDKHYQVTGKGTIDFIAPATSMATTGYNTSFFWQFGNQALLLPYEYEANGNANFYKEMVGQNKNYSYSPVFGFIFDSSSVINETTAVNNVCAQYQRALECGSVDPATELPKFIAKLQEAGIDKIIKAKQDQINVWAANKKK